MTVIHLVLMEFRRFRGSLPRAALMALALLPLLYGSLYLWSNWDPYGRTSKIPVAVVNADQAVRVNGQTIDAGALLVAELRKSNLFKWEFTSSEKARKGIRNGTYYFTISVPSDFSAKLASPITGTPEQATVAMTMNDANGYVVGIMGRTMQVRLEEEIDAAAFSAYTRYALGDVGALRQSLIVAAQSATDLQNGADSAKASADTLASGLGQQAAGNPALGQVAQGQEQLAAGLGELATGAGSLADGLNGAVAAVPGTGDQQQQNQTANVAGNPVTVTTENLNPVHIYGRGLAPFFFSIALWVFSLAVFLLLRTVSPRALAANVNGLSVAVAGWLSPAILGALGAAILYLVVDIGLGLETKHLAAMIGLLILGSAAFVAINQCVRLLFGVPAELVSLVLLMLQLTSAGALYPVETTPLLFRALHPLLPMTYLVDGLRVAIGGGNGWHLARAFIVLAGFLAVSLGISAWLATRHRVWTMSRLKPRLKFAS